MKKTRTIQRRSDCPISFGLDIFGDKWTLLILRDIMFYNRTHFSEFAPQEHTATNILADRLERLESAGIIEKHPDDKSRGQYIYSITEKGKDLLPALIELTLWGLRYDGQTPASKNFVDRVSTEKQKVAREITRSIKRGAFAKYRQNHLGIS